MDLMTDKWPLYEKPLREQFAKMDLAPAKMNFVLLAARDAYLRCAPSLVDLPDCPPEINQYVFNVTHGFLAQVARYAGISYEISEAACVSYGAVLTARAGPIETPTHGSTKEAP